MTADGFADDAVFMPDAVPTELDAVTGEQVPIKGEIAEADNEPPQITVPAMKKMLRSASETLDGWAGLGSGRQTVRADLAFTETEIDLIAPGVCKYANARPAVRAAFGPNEYLKLGIGTIMYGFRVTNEHRATLEEELDAQAEQIAAEAPQTIHATEPASVGEALRAADA